MQRSQTDARVQESRFEISAEGTGSVGRLDGAKRAASQSIESCMSFTEINSVPYLCRRSFSNFNPSIQVVNSNKKLNQQAEAAFKRSKTEEKEALMAVSEEEMVKRFQKMKRVKTTD
jgi:hypothetical protein